MDLAATHGIEIAAGKLAVGAAFLAADSGRFIGLAILSRPAEHPFLLPDGGEGFRRSAGADPDPTPGAGSPLCGPGPGFRATSC